MRNKKQQTRIKKREIYIRATQLIQGPPQESSEAPPYIALQGKKIKENNEPQRERRKKKDEREKKEEKEEERAKSKD